MKKQARSSRKPVAACARAQPRAVSPPPSRAPRPPRPAGSGPGWRRRAPAAFFFFKQKTAYEIGLGIPAEPLFRSDVASSAPVLQTPKATSSTLYFDSLTVNAGNGRSEERRVGKECRSGGSWER